MAISLSKGGNLSLTKAAPGLTRARVGLGWDTRATDGAAFDLDATAFLVTESGRVRSDGDFVFYNQATSPEGSVKYLGDNRTGAGDGDDEQLVVELQRVPEAVQRIVVCVSIDEAEARRQNFGMVRNAYVRVVDDASGTEIARFDLGEDASLESAVVFGELYRHGGEWKFRAVGQGFQGGLGPLARHFGVNV
jgi:tellurium resistance protein TerD